MKTLVRMTKRKTEMIHIAKISNESGGISIDFIEIKTIIRQYYEQLYATKLENLGEMDKLLEINYKIKLRTNRKSRQSL